MLAGERIATVYNDPSADFCVEKKADDSPLTIADKQAHEAIAGILRHTPFPILSEEGSEVPYAERSRWQTLWVVDPLDGTKEFIKRNGEFTVNIALVRHGVPCLGVIYWPVGKKLFLGWEEFGACLIEGITSREGRTLDELLAGAIRLPLPRKREHAVAVASRSHLSPEAEQYIEQLRQRYGSVELQSAGSSLKICKVASGEADVYPRFAPTMEWDTAAGHAIARAAGCEIYQAGTHIPLTYNKADLHNPFFIVEARSESPSDTSHRHDL